MTVLDLMAAQKLVRTLPCPNCWAGSGGGQHETCGIIPRGDHAGRWSAAVDAGLITEALYVAAVSAVGAAGPVMAGAMVPEFTAASAAVTAAAGCARCRTVSHEIEAGVQPGDQWACVDTWACGMRTEWNVAGGRCGTCGGTGTQPAHGKGCAAGRPYRVATLTRTEMAAALMMLAHRDPASLDGLLESIDHQRITGLVSAMPLPGCDPR
jgi:hypothetical protein